jgi:predicted GTPase
MGYGPGQVRDLEATINACDCEMIVSATPIDLTRVVALEKPVVRVRYGYRDNGRPTLGELVKRMLSQEASS